MRVARIGVSWPPARISAELGEGPVWVASDAVWLADRLRRAGVEAIPGDEVPDDATFVAGPDGPLYDVVHIVERLLAPDGCPWDRKQTNASLIPYLIEEAYEVAAAVDGPPEGLRDELGDVLLQPLLHGQVAANRTGAFDADAIASGLRDKLVRRHPHVFGAETAADETEVLAHWNRAKAAEGAERPTGVLDGAKPSLPTLRFAQDVSTRAAGVGFEWPDLDGIYAKVEEELAEVRAAVASGDLGEIEGEIGDLLFTVIQISRRTGVDPDLALRRMVERFCARFRTMEARTTRPLADLSPDEWDALWVEAKRAS